MLLATDRPTSVQAAEIRHGAGVFWGVQDHPEIDLDEVAAALHRDADSPLSAGLVRSRPDLAAQVALIRALHEEPGRRDLAWRLGLDEEVTEARRRRTELRNFIELLVKPRCGAGRRR